MEFDPNNAAEFQCMEKKDEKRSKKTRNIPLKMRFNENKGNGCDNFPNSNPKNAHIHTYIFRFLFLRQRTQFQR